MKTEITAIMRRCRICNKLTLVEIGEKDVICIECLKKKGELSKSITTL